MWTRETGASTLETEREVDLKAAQKRWPCLYEKHFMACLTSTVVSSGEFGIALRYYADVVCASGIVMRRLKQSSTFMRMVKDLDKRYVAWNGPAMCVRDAMGRRVVRADWADAWKPVDGVLSAGRFAGKRVIDIVPSGDGSSAERAGSLPGNWEYDIIHVEAPVAQGATPGIAEVARWVATIAHETAHLLRISTAPPLPAGALVADRIRAAIDDEMATRRTERAILDEIGARAGSAFRDAARDLARDTERAKVERSFISGSVNVTYLEHFTLDHLALDARAREKLTEAQRTRIDAEVEAIPLPTGSLDQHVTDPFPMWWDPASRIYRTIATDYGKFRFYRRVADARWKKRYPAAGGGLPAQGDPTTCRQHEQGFFSGVVKYTP